ncbi:hypothetical protein OIU76_028377 [Salix suchowensis]|uniref:Uncharacterized protein n=1 Tax=Salix suchowensis TaxID=1278906 RepID=A0ABQ9B554_9ROSI|nr:hypothetical protein OIU76_028377 [Salix suchowensis]KAJ6371460.1 hypothetical protein OIU77_001882 [Salix suchowensis]
MQNRTTYLTTEEIGRSLIEESSNNTAVLFWVLCDSAVVEVFPGVACQWETSPENNISVVENISCIKHPMDYPKSSNSSGSLESESVVSGPSEADAGQLNNLVASHSALSFCPSSSKSIYTATTLYAEAKQSFTNTSASEEASIVEKSVESGEVSNSYDN